MKLNEVTPLTMKHLAVTISLIIVAAASRVWPLQSLGSTVGWITFYPAVMVISIYGGLWSGLLATLTICLIVTFFWSLIVTQPFIKSPADWLGVAVFIFTGTMISSVAEAMIRARERVKKNNVQLETANRKLESEITQRQEAEENLRQINIKLEAMNKELEAFSYSVSHDLRGPLRAIDGFSRILLQDYMNTLDDEGKRLLNIVSNNTKKMGQLIDDILSFSRVGREEIGLSEINMGKLVKDVLGELNQDAVGRKIKIEVRPLPDAHADISMIRQVLFNLLSNAIKFTKPRESAFIEVGCNPGVPPSDKGGRSGSAENVYYVKDNGVGFDMKYVSKLFGVFQRLHGADEFEGTGIGLAIVKRVIERHGGRVWAEGKINEGATFSFTLPGIILKK